MSPSGASPVSVVAVLRNFVGTASGFEFLVARLEYLGSLLPDFENAELSGWNSRSSPQVFSQSAFQLIPAQQCQRVTR